MKVQLNDKKVNHHFYYFEEWIEKNPGKGSWIKDQFPDENQNLTEREIQQQKSGKREESQLKFLRRVYFGKIVKFNITLMVLFFILILFFFVQICNGQNKLVHKYNLSKRGFIGNTTMDPLLSLVMSNMAQVKQHSLVYDPFVGTGSLLVGAAHFGASVLGADLDYNLIHSQGKIK